MRRFVLPLLVLTLAAMAVPQTAAPLPEDLDWERLSGPAGTIFAGTVLRIEPGQAANGGPATVRISFRVDEALRGCSAGQTISLDEWAELWVSGNRYREGQRVLMFLYPPGAAGLSSPVAGDLGIVNLGPQGRPLLTPRQAHFLSSQTATTTSQSGARSSHDESQDSARAGLRNFLRKARSAEVE